MDDVTNPIEPQRPRQFGLKSLFVVTALVAMVCGTFHWFGILGGMALIVVGLHGACVYSWQRQMRRTGSWIAVVAIIDLGLFVLGLPLFCQRPRVNTRENMCRNHLKQIGLGLQIYADIYGCLPPAFIADESGRPMHSWRVLILPFIEQKALYQQYRFDEPWDGPHNRLLVSQMPTCYRCPAEVPWPSVMTSYLAVTGPETVWPGNESIAWPQVTDGTSNTLAVVEVAGEGINWMEPRDLLLEAFYGKDLTGLNLLGSHPTGSPPTGAMALFCDGHTNFLQKGTPTATLKALATRAGGETIVGDF